MIEFPCLAGIIVMLKIKRILVAAILISGLLAPTHAAKAEFGAKPLRVGYFKVAPHAMPDPQGRADGVAVTYFQRVAREMGAADIAFVLLPLNRLLLELERGQVDMALLLAKDSARSAKFVYPDKPFCVTKPSIAVSTSNPLQRVTTVEDLLPLSFHETPGNYHCPVMRDPRLEIEPLTGDNFTRRCFAMIVAGRIDACYQPDHYPIQFEAVREDFITKVKVLYLPDPPVGLYSVFSRNAAPDYRQRYETALTAVKQGRSYGDEYEAFMAGYREE
jgi:hypothetical protein